MGNHDTSDRGGLAPRSGNQGQTSRRSETETPEATVSRRFGGSGIHAVHGMFFQGMSCRYRLLTCRSGAWMGEYSERGMVLAAEAGKAARRQLSRRPVQRPEPGASVSEGAGALLGNEVDTDRFVLDWMAERDARAYRSAGGQVSIRRSSWTTGDG